MREHDQVADRRGEGTGEGRRGEEQQSADQHRAAAVAVAERTVEELADREAQHVGGERELYAVGSREEVVTDRRHDRRVDAHGERAEAAQRHQQGNVGGRPRRQRHFGLRFRSTLGAEVATQPTLERHLLLLPRHARVVMAERATDLVERDIGKHAAVGEILHVAPAAEIERVIDRIAHRIPLERLQPEALREFPIEGRCRLHPAPVQPDVGVAVIEEHVAAHQFGQPLGRHVVAHVGVADAGREAGGPADGGHDARLVHAIAVPRRQRRAGAVGLALHRRVVGVVPEIVAHRVVEPERPLAVGSFTRHAPCIGHDFGVL